MSERRIRRLSVIDDKDNLRGIISARDIAKYYSEVLESLET